MQRLIVLAVAAVLFLTVPVVAGVWRETTQTDFADGDYNANIYASTEGGDSGCVKVQPGALYDLNKDGYKDIVISNMHDNTVNFNIPSYIYWGSAAGFDSTNRTALPTHGATGNSVADLNRDGYLDIVFSSYSGPNSLIYWGSKTGFHLGDTTALPTVGAHGSYVADLNHDGRLDIIFANFSGSYSYVYWGSNGGYSSSKRTELPTLAATDVAVADLNKDGKLDLVFSNCHPGSGADMFDGYSYIYYGQGTDSIYYSTASMDSLHTHGAYGNSVADLNRDGWLDIIFSNHRVEATFKVCSYIYYGSPSGFSSSNMDSLPTLSAIANAVADLNKDGYPDIVFANWYDDVTYDVNSYIYWGSATGFNSANRTELPVHGSHGALVGKLDHDGFLDIILTGFRDGTGNENTFSYIYWGSASGYAVSNRDSLPSMGGHISTKDNGNVHNRSLVEGYSSSIFDAGETVNWGIADWTADVPLETSLDIMVRSGNTPIPDGTWSDWQAIPIGSDIPDVLNSRYIQYQAVTTSNELFDSPTLDDITIDYFPLGVEEQESSKFKVQSSKLMQSYPNPFSQQTAISYQLSVSRSARLVIYNVAGQLVKTLVSGPQSQGVHTVNWDGTDNKGNRVSAGVYFVSFEAGDYKATKKIVCLR
ncbi:MAG: FG-GAP-like repeat-containing protein [Candidatus Edwardsbacteria bacterium]